MPSIKVILFLVLLLGLTNTPLASKYTPPGLYDIEYLTLHNGLDVVLKRRTQAHNVVLSLVVGVGLRHFECNKRETAHFLEHMLFKGTSKHTEKELDRLIEDHGGEWNGYTRSTETEYAISIYDRNLPVAMDTLNEIITDTVITQGKVDLARDVIHLENGGKTSRLRRWLYERGIGKSAAAKAVEVLLPGIYCPGLPTPDGITEADIIAAHKAYYVPDNMTLVVVGNFERDKLLSHIKRTFGRMKRSTHRRRKLAVPPYPSGAKTITGTLSPILGSDGEVMFAFRTDGEESPDSSSLWVLGEYLDRVLYEKIRVDEGLAYSPGASNSTDEKMGYFIIHADSELEKIEQVKRLLKKELEKIRREPPKTEEVEAVKQSILLSQAQGYESNGDLADYYISNLYELKARGKLSDREALLERVTPEDLQRVAAKYFVTEREVIVWSTPTLTFTQFYIGLGLMIALLAGFAYYAYHRLAAGRGSN